MRILMIGTGECGGNLLDEFSRQALGTSRLGIFKTKRLPRDVEVETIVVNTAPRDLSKLDNVKRADKIDLEEHGVGMNREKGKTAYSKNKERILREVEDRSPFDLSFLFTSLGGGTGSAFTPELIADLRERLRLNSYVISVLPFRKEGSILIENAGFSLRDIIEANPLSNILIDNEFLRGGRSYADAHKIINRTVAERFMFLLKVLNSDQIVTADLGDLETCLSAGTGLATLGYGKQRNEDESVGHAIRRSTVPENLLFNARMEDVGRALFLVWGDERFLDTAQIMDQIEELGTTVGQPLRGVAIGDELPKVLTLLNLTEIGPVENITRMLREAIMHERERKRTARDRRKEVIERIDRFEPEY